MFGPHVPSHGPQNSMLKIRCFFPEVIDVQKKTSTLKYWQGSEHFARLRFLHNSIGHEFSWAPMSSGNSTLKRGSRGGVLISLTSTEAAVGASTIYSFDGLSSKIAPRTGQRPLEEKTSSRQGLGRPFYPCLLLSPRSVSAICNAIAA